MTLQTSGSIALDDVNSELGNSSGDQIAMDDSDVRGLSPNATYADALNGPGINTTPGSIISMSELYGASAAGSGYTSLSRSAASVNEGSSISFTVNTTGITNGTTVGYTVTGISSADLSSGSLTGNITINSNTGSVTFGIAADYVTEGSETLTITLAATDSAGNSTGSLSSSAVINDTSTSLTVSISGVLNGSVTGCYNTTITTAYTSTATTSVSGGSGGYTYYWDIPGGVYSTSGVFVTGGSFTNGRYASSNSATVTGYASPVSSSGSNGWASATIRVTVTDSVGNTATATTSAYHSFSWHAQAGHIYSIYCVPNDSNQYYTYATNDCGGSTTAVYQTCSPTCLSTLTVYTSGNFNASVSGSAGSDITATSGSVGAIFGGSSGGTTFYWDLDSYTVSSGITATAASFGGTRTSQYATGSVTATRATAGSGYVDVNISVTVTDSCGRTATGYATGRFNFTFT